MATFIFGVGAAHSAHSQTTKELASDLSQKKVSAPALSLELRHRRKSAWGLVGSYTQSQGQFEDVDDVSYEGSEFTQRTFSLEATRDLEGFEDLSFQHWLVQMSLRGGIRLSDIPFADRTTEPSGLTFTADNLSIWSLTGGIDFEVFQSQRWRWGASSLLTVPVSSTLEISSAVGLIGALSATFKPKNSSWIWGLQWRGSLLDYDFSNRDKITGEALRGHGRQTDSTLELRIGHLWF